MNIRSIVNHKAISERAIGVVAHYGNDHADPVFAYCHVRKSADSLYVLEAKSNLAAEELEIKLETALQEGVRVHVNVQSDRILVKRANVASSDLDVFSLFPFADPKDILYQISEGREQSFVSVCTRSLVERLPNFITFADSVVGYSVGPCVLESLSAIVTAADLIVTPYKVRIENGTLISVGPTDLLERETVQEIGDNSLSGQTLLAYAAACSVLIGYPLIISDESLVTKGQSNFKFINRVYRYGSIILIALFVAAAINAGCQLYLQPQIEEMQTTQLRFADRVDEVTADQHKRDEARKVAATVGWSRNRMPLYYADQLAASLPANITLTKLEIGMMDLERAKQERVLRFLPNEIHVKGDVLRSDDLQQWMETIESLYWVVRISDQTYSYNTRTSLSSFEFVVHIK